MKNIYLTDDDEDDRMLIRSAIEAVVKDANIIELSNGELLSGKLDEQPNQNEPALILMDMNMPRMNGLEALARLKSNPKHLHIPVVMISTTVNTGLLRQAYEGGVNAFLEKPILEQDFIRLAQAVDVCFLNSSQSVETQETKKPEKVSNILVVEDNEDHMFFIRHALQQSMPGVNGVEIDNKSDVMEQIASKWEGITPTPHLILMDLYLPAREDGLKLLVEMRKFLMARGLLAIPVVVFSYSDDPEDIQASYQHNANAYMIKGTDASQWTSDFKSLHNFWWNTVKYSR